MEQLVARAKANKQRIVLAEGTEERTIKAADQLLGDEVADIILIGSKAEIAALVEKFALKNIDKATIIDPKDNPDKSKYVNLLYDLRKNKGLTMDQAEALVENPLYLGALIIKAGEADGEVAGAQNTTGDVLRPALQIIKTARGISCVSGAFIMLVPNKVYGSDGVMVFADCAVTPNPEAPQLAQIAVCAAQTAKDIAGIEPVVGMLSFSTKGSAKHEMVDKVVEATRLAKELDPSLKIDGELQADAAIVPSVGASKAPGSEVAGKCNTLVFPTLEVGNIAYKLVQRLAGATAIGPILQGIAAPVNDLSRGCSIDDVYKVVCITCNQAIGAKERAAKQ